MDDSEFNRELLKEMLIGTYAPAEANSGRQCLRMLDEYGTKISAVLLDIIMPEMDGLEVLSQQDCRNISVASSLHDIGKVLIDPAILNKPGKLTAKEYEIMKEHAILGEKILRREELASFQNEPLLKIAIQICRYHHERYDGKGYPDVLCGDDIPIAAQVVGIADVYDALVNDRSYKKAIPSETALEMISRGDCGCFNPILIECLNDIKEKLTLDIYG